MQACPTLPQRAGRDAAQHIVAGYGVWGQRAWQGAALHPPSQNSHKGGHACVAHLRAEELLEGHQSSRQEGWHKNWPLVLLLLPHHQLQDFSPKIQALAC